MGTAYGIRLLIPAITAIPWAPVSMLDEWGQLQYETESYVFIASVIIFLFLFLCGLLLNPLFRKHIPILMSVARRGIFAISIAVIIQPFNQYLFHATSYTFLMIVLSYAGMWSAETYIFRRLLPSAVSWSIVTIALAKICLPVFYRFDTGMNPNALAGDYLPIGLTAICMLFLHFVWKKSVGANFLQKICSKPVIGVFVFVSIAAMLTRLMIQVLPTGTNTNYDIYLIVSPAYALIKGATPFVNFMSMYGILSLFPWIFWLAAFPSLPVSPAMMVVVTTIGVMLYIAFFLYVTGTIIKRRVIWVLTALSMFYYAFMVRAYIPNDAASLLSFPATTPLRFGMFLVPLLALIRYVKTGSEKHLRWFLLISEMCLLFSFEMGVGWFAAGIAASILSLITIQQTQRTRVFFRLSRFILYTFTAFITIVVAAVYFRSGKFPDISMYTFYPKFFGASGYYMLPIGSEIAYWMLILTAAVGFARGMYLLVVNGNRNGIIVVYLSFIQFALLPYYMGRSLFQTLVSVTLPSTILWGLLTEDALGHFSWVKKNLAASFIAVLFGVALLFSSWRTVYQSGLLWNNPALQAKKIISFIKNAVSDWPVKQTPQYAFLKEYLPEGCPLVSFDSLEYELPPALGVRPALNYPQLRFMVITYGQIDSFLPNYRNGFYCLFMNKKEYEHVVTYGIYEYYWLKIEPKATMIAQDPQKGFALYTISR